MATSKYSYSKSYEERSRRSAKEIIPFILELLHPRSVIDVGCGLGSWLSVFKEMGVGDICGIDGEWVDKEQLVIPKEKFLCCDLKLPIRMEKIFDLVISLEVGEHLPPECAELYIDTLTNLGPVVLFSAAIPYQGGGPHLNEQWPDYWVRLFSQRGYLTVDCMRRKIWKNEEVEWWYAQNMFIFAEKEYVEKYPLLKEEFAKTEQGQLSIVHPRKYIRMVQEMSDPRSLPLGKVMRALPNLIEKALKSGIKKRVRVHLSKGKIDKYNF